MNFKLFSFLILICFTTNSYSQNKIKLKGVLVENDYHENISWIKSKPISLVKKDFSVSALSVSYMQLYFGLKVVDGEQKITPLRLVNNYQDKDWIFYDEISYLFGSRKEIKYGKGKVFKIKNVKTTKDVNVKVSEYSDVIVDSNVKDLIKYILSNDTGLNIRYLDKRDNRYREIQVPGGTKKFKKHFTSLLDSYNKLVEAYSVGEKF